MAVTLVDLGRVRARSSCCGTSGLARPPRRVPRARRLRARDRRPARPPARPTSSMKPRPRRHLAPRALPSSCASGSRSTATAAGGARGRARATRPSASRPATAPSSTSPRDDDAEDAAVAALTRSRAIAAGELAPALYRLRDEAAALHLFRVAAGLDSMVPGEGEILGQVRAAYEAGATGPAPRPPLPPGAARGQEGPARDGDRREPRLGLVGRRRARAAGVRRPRRAARVLLDRRRKIERAGRAQPASPAAREIAFVANRTLERAAGARGRCRRRRARRSTASTRELARRRRRRLLDERARASCSTRRRSTARCAPRRGRPLFLIDLAVPRDLDPAINELDGCYLYDIDDLEAVVAETLAGRRARGRARGGDRRRRGGALPGVAGVARRRARDRVAARARGGDPRRASSRGASAARRLSERRAAARRVGHGADRRTSSCTCRPFG